MACTPLVKSRARSCIGFFLCIPLAFLRPNPGCHAANPDCIQLYPDHHRYGGRSSWCLIVSLSATDDLSGVRPVIVNMVSPSGAHTLWGSTTFSPPVISGSGIANVTFPQFSEVGIWTVRDVVVGDAVGNTRIYRPAELAQLGFPTTLVVMGQEEDVTPPTLTAFSFTPDHHRYGGRSSCCYSEPAIPGEE